MFKRLSFALLMVSCGLGERSGVDAVARSSQALDVFPSYPVAASSASLPSAEMQSAAQAVWDGSNFLVVWPDSRPGTSDSVFGTRYSATGVMRDPHNFVIAPLKEGSTTTHAGSSIGLASNGTLSLAVWLRSTPDSSGRSRVVLESASVSQAGAVTQTTAPTPVNVSLGAPVRLRVAASTSGFLAVWSTPDAVQAMTFDLSGAPTSATPLTLQAGWYPTAPDIVWDGTNYIVVWSGRLVANGTQGAWLRRYTSTGVAVDAAPVHLSANIWADDTAIAWLGAQALVVWTDDGGSRGSSWDIKGAIVTGASPGNVVTINAATGWQRRPAVRFDGTTALVTWDGDTYPNVYATLVTPAGALVSTTPVEVLGVGTGVTAPAVAWGGGTYFVAATRFVLDSGYDVVGARVSKQGALVDPSAVELSTATPAQRHPRVAWAGDTALVVWSAWNGVNWDIDGARFDRSGRPLDATPIVISAAKDNQTEPAVASNGTSFFVVWTDDRNDFTGHTRDIFGTAVTNAGEVKAPEGLTVATRSTSIDTRRGQPTIAFNGQDYAAAWWESLTTLTIEVTTVTAEGVVAVNVTAGAVDGDSYAPGLACNLQSHQCAVAFPIVAGNQRPLAVVRFNSALLLQDATPTRMRSTGSASSPAIAHDGTRYVLVWRDSTYPNPPELRAGRIGNSGSPLDLTPALLAGAPAGRAAVSVDRGQVQVLWQVGTSDALELRAAALDVASGVSLAGVPAVISQTPGSAREPDVAANAGRIFWVWSAWQQVESSMQVIGRQGATQAHRGASCTHAGDCASGFCVDEVCCDSACAGGQNDCQACSMLAGAVADGTCAPIKDGALCDDKLACTHADVCTQGACGGVTNRPPPAIECKVIATTCNPTTGDFAMISAVDGTVCANGKCEAGACVSAVQGDGGATPVDGGTVQSRDAGSSAMVDAGATGSSAPNGCGCSGGTGETLLGALALVFRKRRGQRAVPPRFGLSAAVCLLPLLATLFQCGAAPGAGQPADSAPMMIRVDAGGEADAGSLAADAGARAIDAGTHASDAGTVCSSGATSACEGGSVRSCASGQLTSCGIGRCITTATTGVCVAQAGQRCAARDSTGAMYTLACANGNTVATDQACDLRSQRCKPVAFTCSSLATVPQGHVVCDASGNFLSACADEQPQAALCASPTSCSSDGTFNCYTKAQDGAGCGGAAVCSPGRHCTQTAATQSMCTRPAGVLACNRTDRVAVCSDADTGVACYDGAVWWWKNLTRWGGSCAQRPVIPVGGNCIPGLANCGAGLACDKSSYDIAGICKPPAPDAPAECVLTGQVSTGPSCNYAWAACANAKTYGISCQSQRVGGQLITLCSCKIDGQTTKSFSGSEICSATTTAALDSMAQSKCAWPVVTTGASP